MKKKIFIFAFFFSTLLCFSQDFFDKLSPTANRSVVYVSSCDWGACIEKIVINTVEKKSPQIIRAKDFKVNQILFPKSTNIGMIKGELPVTDAFSSDSAGNKIEQPSNFITIRNFFKRKIQRLLWIQNRKQRFRHKNHQF